MQSRDGLVPCPMIVFLVDPFAITKNKIAANNFYTVQFTLNGRDTIEITSIQRTSLIIPNVEFHILITI